YAQVDVLDAWTPIPHRVESASVEKYLPPNGAAAAPERRGTFVAVLVHEVVQQVAVLREEIGRRRRLVVRPERRRQVGFAIEQGDEIPQRVWFGEYVGVQKIDEWRAGGPSPDVARVRWTTGAAAGTHDACTVRRGDSRRSVAGAVINDDALPADAATGRE